MDRLDFDSTDVILLADVPGVTANQGYALEAYVRSGGGLILFTGNSTDGSTFDQNLFRGGQGPLPGKLVRRIQAPRGAPFHPSDVDRTHPSLLPFADTEGGDLGLLEIYSYWETSSWPQETAVLARVKGGSPWILERRFALGRVVLVTTSALDDDSDLPLTPLFPPLLHRLVKYAANSVNVIPDLYPDEDSSPSNVPPEESLLERVGDTELASLKETIGFRAASAEDDFSSPSLITGQKEVEYWPHASVAALAFLLLELLFLRTIGGKPQTQSENSTRRLARASGVEENDAGKR